MTFILDASSLIGNAIGEENGETTGTSAEMGSKGVVAPYSDPLGVGPQFASSGVSDASDALCTSDPLGLSSAA